MSDALGVLDETRNISKQAFKSVQRDMLERFASLAELIYEHKRAAVVVFEGWDAAGKGTTIRALTEHLDARGYKVLATQAPRTHETQKPWLWRFWMNLPRYGQIAIFDRSWYGRVLVERVRGLTPMPEWIAAYEEINQFERTLADDGTIFLKFWLHISRREQLRRFMLLTQDPSTAWQVTAEDWENHRLYDEYVAAVRDMLSNTNRPCAPWAVVDATDREVRMYSVCRAMIDRLEQTLDVEASAWPSLEELAAESAETGTKASKHAKRPKAEKQAKDKAKDKPAVLNTGDESMDPGGKKKKKKDKDKDKGKKKKLLRPATPEGSTEGNGFGAGATSADEAIDSGGMMTDSGEAAAAEGGTYA